MLSHLVLIPAFMIHEAFIRQPLYPDIRDRQSRHDPALRELNELGWSRILLCHFTGKGTQLGGFLASALGPYGQDQCDIHQCSYGGGVPENRFFSMCLEFLGKLLIHH